MSEEIIKRVLAEAEYILQTGATVRKTAQVCGASKSTVHTDMTQRLQELDQAAARQVRRILDTNLAERHIRGGKATCEKYKKHHTEG